jgi:hypothetical protein
MKCLDVPIRPRDPRAAAHIGRAAHDINHNRRAILKGKCSCEVFHGRPRGGILPRRQRKEVAEELIIRAGVILAEMGGTTRQQAQKAWRIVAEDWLLKSGHVVETTNNVLPYSSVLYGL